jgi:acyl-homoserine lactone acylase PvdQ
MALTFSEGSIGGDIESVPLRGLMAFYGNRAGSPPPQPPGGEADEPGGSNGIAIAPSNTASHHAMLLINPHTSFFFRAEVQVASGEGLNAYGAVTWGQFFVYQGFNDRAGWMHTTSGVDDMDEYAETIVRKPGGIFYRYGGGERPVLATKISIPCRTATGTATRVFTVYRTHHGPIIRDSAGKWISVRMMQQPVKALMQSWLRTKARTYREFLATMELHTNSSNNTVFADADGDIAYFHGNFIPKRDPRFDWTKPVDGSDPRTEWQGLLTVDESPHLLNPANGWLYNTNNAPWSAAGPQSPRKADFPAYVEKGGENPRGLHAIRVLEGRKDFTLGSLITGAFDSYLTAFQSLVPALLKAYDGLSAADPLRSRLAEQVRMLQDWDRRWSVSSVPTALAVYWGQNLDRRFGREARRAEMSVEDYAESATGLATPQALLAALGEASDRLRADFGTWKTPWGEINRFQRLTGDIVQRFDDAAPSIPVGFTSSRWGSLASFGARTYPGTRRMYGTSGNSFVAVVEFGDSVRARAVTAGGESGDPASPHFNDQADRYSRGELREVYYYPSQLAGHIEREYHPGE